MYFHEEEHLFDSLQDGSGNRYSPVTITFAEGDAYKCVFNTAWESDNGLDDDDPNFDEYWEEWYDVVEIIRKGPNLEHSISPEGAKSPIVLITYKQFPVMVTAEDGRILYQR